MDRLVEQSPLAEKLDPLSLQNDLSTPVNEIAKTLRENVAYRKLVEIIEVEIQTGGFKLAMFSLSDSITEFAERIDISLSSGTIDKGDLQNVEMLIFLTFALNDYCIRMHSEKNEGEKPNE